MEFVDLGRHKVFWTQTTKRCPVCSKHLLIQISPSTKLPLAIGCDACPFYLDIAPHYPGGLVPDE